MQVNKTNEVEKTHCAIIDITQRKQIEKALKESEERFDLAVKASNNGIFDWNIESNETYNSPVWKQQIGYEDHELENVNDTFMNLLHPDDKPKVMDYLEKYLSGEIRVYDNEFRLKHKNGSYRWIRAIAHAMRDENDKPYRMLGSHIDITEKKEKEILINKANEELSKLNAEKDKFFSIIAHDLRSPLGGVMTLTDLINTEFENLEKDELKGMIKTLDKTTGNVYKLLENLLEWSRLQRGLIPYEPQEYNLYELVAEATRDLINITIKKEIIFKVEIDRNLTITADRPMLLGIVRNFASNALKFTPNGGKVTISAELTEKYVETRFVDTGIGMSDKIKDNLFNIEVNTSRKGTEGESSSGLGLILCKEFVEKHNGIILVESKIDEGSTFIVQLPQ